MSDPWREVAIDRQFREVVKEPKDTLPAALTWIAEEIASGHYRSNRTLEAGYDYLICALPRDVFAGALVAILWPEQTLAESMEGVLDDDARNLHYFRGSMGVRWSRLTESVFRATSMSPFSGSPRRVRTWVARNPRRHSLPRGTPSEALGIGR